jgi:hypothetical protein
MYVCEREGGGERERERERGRERENVYIFPPVITFKRPAFLHILGAAMWCVLIAL